MPTNRFGNKKPTKDGQSRSMRQKMAEGRRKRGETGIKSAPSEGRTKPTTSQQRSNRQRGAAARRNRGGADKMTQSRSNYSPKASDNRKAPKVPKKAQTAARNVGNLRRIGKTVLGALSPAGIVKATFGQKAADGTLKGKPVRKDPKKSVGKYNTRDKDGTVRSRLKVGPKKVGTYEQAFDKSYASAKKAGKKEFNFKGKRYNTK